MTMMITRTDSSNEILNESIRLGLIECQVCVDGEWKPVTDRSVLFAALINELILEARREGLQTVDDNGTIFEPNAVDGVYCSPFEDDDEDESENDEDTIIYDCTPVPDDHVFEDDCEKVAPGDCPMGWDRV